MRQALWVVPAVSIIFRVKNKGHPKTRQKALGLSNFKYLFLWALTRVGLSAGQKKCK